MVKISAQVQNSQDTHQVILKTGGNEHAIAIPPKSTGFGSSANGAELLFLALATCYCNDIYREAQLRNMVINHIQVEAEGDYDGIPGHPVENVKYHVTLEAEASEAEIEALILHTDTMAEIQNTLRQGTSVSLGSMRIISSQ